MVELRLEAITPNRAALMDAIDGDAAGPALPALTEGLRARRPRYAVPHFEPLAPDGVFSVAREVASLPASEIVAPIRAALLPGYSKLAASPND